MILTGETIREAVNLGDIEIQPFDVDQINPNSYNYRLGGRLIEITHDVSGRLISEHCIPAKGFLLRRNSLYLGVTEEYFATSKYVMTLLGRSSMGRLGLFVNLSSDLGHIGSKGHWTLELMAVQPIVVYSGMRIGQIAFWEVDGSHTDYKGQYLHDVMPSRNRDLLLEHFDDRSAS